MFEILQPELKSLAVRASVWCAPHPYVCMALARALLTGLGIVSEGLAELSTRELPDWEESKIQTLPMVNRKRLIAHKHHSGGCRKTRLRDTFTSKFARGPLRNSSSNPSRQERNVMVPHTQMAHTSGILRRIARCSTRCDRALRHR